MPELPDAGAVRLLAWPALDAAQREAVNRLRISQEHESFAGTIARAVAECEANSGDDLCGVAVVDGHEVVGFLVMKRRTRAPDWALPDDAVLSALRIDQRQQGRGLGSMALALLPAWVRAWWPEARCLALSVDEHNAAGIKTYARAGWIDQGVRVAGRIGFVRYMRLVLDGMSTPGRGGTAATLQEGFNRAWGCPAPD